MTAHDDRARDERPGIDVQGDVDPADIRHDEQPAPTYTCRSCDRSLPWTDGQSTAAGDPVDEYWCQFCGEEQPLPPPDEQPAPTMREIPAGELAKAGHLSVETARDMLLHPGGYARSLLALASEVVVTALDVRGRERDAARAEVEAASEVAVDLAADAVQLRAEVERLRDERAELLHSLRESHEEQERMVKSLRYLRARYEAARPVVQAWGFKPLRSAVREAHEDLGIALDALGRAHEDKGQDR